MNIKRKIEAIGAPLKNWNVNIYRGILTGCNEAFIISGEKKNSLIQEDPRSAEIIRPILRGRDIKRYGYDFADLWLLWVPWHFPLHFDETIQGASEKAESLFRTHYPAVYNHLLQYKDLLSNRNQAETGIRYEWYALQRWGAKYWDDFSKQKIAWARLSRISKKDFDGFPRFSILEEDMMTLDSLCFLVGENLDVLVKLLNSKYAAFYFFNNVAILDNGGMQMRQQYVENIPLPPINLIKGANGFIDEMQINHQIFRAFNFSDSEIDYIDHFLQMKKETIENR